MEGHSFGAVIIPIGGAPFRDDGASMKACRRQRTVTAGRIYGGTKRRHKDVLQLGEELRIRSNGDIVADNPELELVGEDRAADAVLLYRFDAQAGEHILRLLDPSPITNTSRSIVGTIEIARNWCD